MHGIELEPYEPTVPDLAFTEQMIGSLKIGVTWGIPRCGLTYQKESERRSS